MKKAVLFVVAVLMGIIVSASEVMTFNVGGDIDKYYPVVFKDVNWGSGSPTELEISRFDVHTDELWRGSLMASFKYHGTQWGHGSAFADAEIRNNVAPFVAGWRDATVNNGTLAFVIWLKGGNTSYYCKYANSNEVPAPVVYIDGYQEVNGPLLTYKTTVDSYVNLSGQTFGNNVFVASNVAAMGNVGIGTTDPKAGLHIYGDKYTLYGPNSMWGEYLQVGGNGRVTNGASVAATNGNLHIDAKDGNFATYINWYSNNNTFINGNGGNVGIGTTTPQAKLHISTNSPKMWKWLELRNTLSLELGENGKVGSLKLNGYDDSQFSFIRSSNGNFHVDSTTGHYFFNWDDSMRNGNSGKIHMADGVGNENIYLNTSGNSWINGGNVGIGTMAPEYKLSVNGTIGAREIVVTSAPWADFVFEPDYKLKTLPEVEAYIVANKRLPDMPSEDEVKEKGANIGDVQAKLLQKIEELTLYVIEQNKQIKKQNKINNKQEKVIKNLKKVMEKLKTEGK